MRWHVFILTFVSYAFYHASRKNLSGVKGSIITEWMSNSTHDPLFYKTSDASSFLGALDALFMMFYAGALVFWGYVGDRWNPLHVVFIGMLGSGFSVGPSTFAYLICRYLAGDVWSSAVLHALLFHYLLRDLLRNIRHLPSSGMAKRGHHNGGYSPVFTALLSEV